MKTANPAFLKQVAITLRAVAHPARIEIVRLLAKHQTLSVNKLQEKLGVSQSMTSQHLSALRRAGVVSYQKEANVCYYRIKNKHVFNLLDCVEKCAAGAEK